MMALVFVLALQQSPVQGMVRDSISAEPVAYAAVAVADSAGAHVEVATDAHGAFVIRGARAGSTLTVRAPGYHDWARRLGRLSGAILILLQPNPIPAAPVSATASRARLAPVEGRAVIDSAVFRSLPKVLETDVLRAATLSPMATSTSDFAAMPAVRGGTAEGVPILLDGVRLFNPYHVGGFMSAINAEAVDHMTISSASGGAGLRQGALSGAIEMVTRDGARDRWRASGAVGLISTRATVEGPVQRQTSLLVDLRRTYLDALTWAMARNGLIESRVPYAFSDVHAKLTTDLGGISRLSFTAYASREGVGDVDRSDTAVVASDWTNLALAMHYRRALAPSLIADFSAGHSAFHSKILVSDLGPPTLDAHGGMGDAQAQAELTWYAAPRLVVAGGTFVGRFASTDSVALSNADVRKIVQPTAARGARGRYGAFAELRLGDEGGSGGALGTRVQHFPGVGAAVAPALRLRLRTPAGLLHLEAAQSWQELYSLRNEESRYASYITYDVLVPVEGGTPLLRGRELALGLHRDGSWYAVDLGGYTSALANLRLVPLGDTPLFGQALIAPDSQALGTGRAWGVEFGGRATRGPWLLMGHYTYAHVRRTVGGITYTPRFTRAHQGGLLARWAGRRSTLTAQLSLQSGAPYTPLQAVLPFMPLELPPGSPPSAWDYFPMGRVGLGGAYNSGRLPWYDRLDVGWSRQGAVRLFGQRLEMQPYVAILNVLNARNVLAADLERDPQYNVSRPTVSYLPQLPVLPFFGVEWRF